MILPKTRNLLSIAAQKSLVFLFCFFIFYLLSFIFNISEALAVPNDGTYYLRANTEMGGAGTSVSSTDYKVTNFSIGEVVGGKPKGSDTASVCESGGSGLCKVNPGWLYTRTKFTTSGNFVSKDFLTGESSTSIDFFTYKLTALPVGTSGTIQFSQDGTNWYNSSGVANGINSLAIGTNTISLSALGWTNSRLYYKVAFTGPGNKTPSLDSVVLGFGANAAKIRPIFTVVTTDSQNDYLQYKIKLCTDAGMTANCQTFDQTASQTGWSGQDATGSTAYKSGSIAYYTTQSDLNVNTTYYWQTWAKDPAGSNTWSNVSSTVSFSTNGPSNVPTVTGPTHGATNVSITPTVTLSATDGASDWLRYKIQIATDSNFSQNLSTYDQTVSQTGWSGQNTQTNTAYTSGSSATYTVQSALVGNTTYYIRAYAVDPAGSNIWSSPSPVITFSTAPPKLPNGTPFGTTAVPGRFGYARSFDGTDDYVSLGNNALSVISGSFTVEGWVKTTSPNRQTIIAESQPGTCTDGIFYIAADSGYLAFTDGAGNTNLGNTTVTDGVWHHVAYVYNNIANSGMTYVDSVPGSSNTAVTWRNTCSTTDTRIGSEVGANYFSGTVDNLRVYNLPISDVKMKQLYYNGFMTGCSTGGGYTMQIGCPACPAADTYVDDGNCGKRLCHCS